MQSEIGSVNSNWHSANANAEDDTQRAKSERERSQR